jgi:hypothetical protein
MRVIATFLLLLAITPLMAQVAVINAAVPEEPIDAKRMAAFLQGRVTTWGDGRAVVLVLVEDPVVDVHLAQIAGREREVLLRAWKRLVFAGNGAMPLLARNVQEAQALVAKTPGAVALLDQTPADPRWRVIPISVVAKR